MGILNKLNPLNWFRRSQKKLDEKAKTHAPKKTKERGELPELRVTKHYCGAKERSAVKALHNRNRRHAEEKLDAARQKTALLRGEPPGFTLAHHDQLVRLYGAKRARELERRILDAHDDMSFAEAIDPGSTGGTIAA